MTRNLPQLGANPQPDGQTRFTVWAPAAERLALQLVERDVSLPMDLGPFGYHTLLADAPPGTRYQFEFPDGRRRPDPASRAQPHGVHGPSMVVPRTSGPHGHPYRCPPLADHVLYELHIGTFSGDGTFGGAIRHLDHLRDLGVTAVEVMPIAQFPGDRNWGYDGVGMFAAQASYGGIEGLRAFIAACHARSLAVIVDVVYNHIGPEGNYLADFGPYFTDRYRTPWGAALNFDGPHSDHVREFFIQSALHWIVECEADGLRLDAIHAIVDHSPITFIEELTARVHQQAAAAGRNALLIAESGDNNPRLVRPPARGGYGLDGCWNDDYHHAVRCALTGESRGYYKPYGQASQISKAIRDRFVFAGEYSSAHERRHGAPAADIPHHQLIAFTQNHDQVGNRPHGDRLDAAAGPAAARTVAALVLLAPFTPMLWMGEEFAETAPFLYFVSHSDSALIEAVRKGRAAEFVEFFANTEPPDPQSPSSFSASKLDWNRIASPDGERRLSFYRALLSLRAAHGLPRLASTVKPFEGLDTDAAGFTYGDPPSFALLANAGSQPLCIPLRGFVPEQHLHIALDTNASTWRSDNEPTSKPAILERATRTLTLSPRSAAVITTEPRP